MCHEAHGRLVRWNLCHVSQDGGSVRPCRRSGSWEHGATDAKNKAIKEAGFLVGATAGSCTGELTGFAGINLGLRQGLAALRAVYTGALRQSDWGTCFRKPTRWLAQAGRGEHLVHQVAQT